MKNVLNDDIVQSPSDHEGINRRSLFKILLTGLLLVLPVGIIFFRPRKKTVFRSEVKCSINDYGYFHDEKLLSIIDNASIGPIKLRMISTHKSENEKGDKVFFSVAFDESMPIESEVDFYVDFYSQSGNLLGKLNTTLQHQSYVAPEWREIDRRATTKVSSTQVYLSNGKRITDVKKMEILVVTKTGISEGIH